MPVVAYEPVTACGDGTGVHLASMRIFDPHPPNASGPEFGIGADHKFICRPIYPVGAIQNLYYASNAEDTARRATGLIMVIRAALQDDDVERFNDLIYGDDVNIDIELLQDVAEYLVEAYTGRPTMPSSGSSAGSIPTPDSSGDGSSATASA